MQLVCWRLLVARNAAYVQFPDAPLPEVQVKMYVMEHILFVGYHFCFNFQPETQTVFEIKMFSRIMRRWQLETLWQFCGFAGSII